MSNQVSKGTTRSGTQCKLKSDSSGYCYIHNPENIAERAKAKEERDRKSARLLYVLISLFSIGNIKNSFNQFERLTLDSTSQILLPHKK